MSSETKLSTRAASGAPETAKGRKLKSATGWSVRATEQGRFARGLADVLVTVPETDRDGEIVAHVAHLLGDRPTEAAFATWFTEQGLSPEFHGAHPRAGEWLGDQYARVV